MSTLPVEAANGKPAPDGLAGGLRYVARQPILDLRNRVYGYELLFRAGPEAIFQGDGELATRTVLDNTVLYGLEKLTGGLPAFVNCTSEALIGNLVHVLPSGMTVLEILESLDPTPALIAACTRLKACGYRIALDDFIWAPKFEPLLDLADYIKVDFLLSGATERQRLLKRLSGVTVALLAEKIETQEEYRQACREGFTLFQGYYFCRPVLLENRRIPANRLSHIEILQLLQGESIDLHKLTRLLKRDASLTYRLLRLVNSPIYGMRQEVRSIQSALVVVGEDAFRRIALLAIASELNAGQPAEILQMAFVRARFREVAARQCALDSAEQYLLGMLSLLPAMLRLPMEELTPLLPLRREIRAALGGEANAPRVLLGWIEDHERGDWAACDSLACENSMDSEALATCYAQAVVWAETALRTVA
ncbi:MAG: EAL and HDOD domain-containing protein [Terracidiphilus sp.]